MFSYAPEHETLYRVVWYGGESTQLHFQKLKANSNPVDSLFTPDGTDFIPVYDWVAIEVRSFMFFPDLKQLLAEMKEFYQFGIEKAEPPF